MLEKSPLQTAGKGAGMPEEVVSSVGEPDIMNRRVPGSVPWESDHRINLRLSIPFLFKRYYVTIVAGEERRSPERRAAERQKHPITTTANVIFLVAAGTILGFAALGALQMLTIYLFGAA